MNPYIFFTLSLVSLSALGQQPIKEYSPKEIQLLDLSPEGALKFEQDEARFMALSRKLQAGDKFEDLSAEDQQMYAERETMESYWDILGAGCSWYCGAVMDDVTASSALPAQGENTYEGPNAHDLSYKTAWVEGVPGPGIGEYLLYTFPPHAPRITEIIVINGYVKSERAYRDNGRVRKLKVYLNNKPFAILNLDDKRSKQHFPFPPIGNGDRDDHKKLAALPPWTLKFEILEVYKGAKYEDTAISEIFFDGIDVH